MGQYPLGELTHFHFTQNNFSFEAKKILKYSIWKLKCKMGQYPLGELTHFHFTQNNFSFEAKENIKELSFGN